MKEKKYVIVLALSIIVVLLLSACSPEVVENEYYTLTIGKSGEGVVIPEVGSHQKERDATIDLEAIAAEGWEFIRWEGEVVDNESAVTKTTMNGNKTITAIFEEISIVNNYTLTIEKSGEGEIIPAVGSYEKEKDSIVDLEAIASDGWTFSSWVGDVADNNNAVTTVTMDDNQTITAIFEEDSSDPNLIDSGNSSVNLVGDISYDKKSDKDLILENDMVISLAEAKLNITLKNSAGNIIENGDYELTIISDISGKILDNEIVSFNSGNGTAEVDLLFLNEGVHNLSVVVDSIQIENSLSVNIESSDLHLYYADIDLNGYKLTVNGNLLQSHGNITINGGDLIVNGNYQLESLSSDDQYEKTSGILLMQNIDDYVYVQNDFVINTENSHSDYLTNGVLEIKGDFKQSGNSSAYGNYSRYNFNTSQNHKVIFSGSSRQNISFDSVKSGFTFIDFVNSDINFSTRLRSAKLVSDSYLMNSINYGFTDSFDLNGNDLSINGDFVQKEAGLINLNGAIFTIKGDFIQEDGEIDLAKGELNVEGDYRLQKQELVEGVIEYTKGDALLEMDEAGDYVKINGNFIMESTSTHEDHLINGILEVKGDFYQIGNSAAYGNYSRYNFDASGSHKVIFTGSTKQEVFFESTGSGFALADINNSNIKFLTSFRGWPIGKDTVVNNSIEEGFTGEFDLNNYQLMVNGDLIQKKSGNMNLNGGKLIVKANLYQPEGTFTINGGLMMVEGDYRLQTTAFDKSNGVLKMLNSEDYVLVKGDFATHSTNSHENYLKDGLLEVKGDFSQIGSSAAYGNYSNSNFKANEKHKVVLSGDSQQNVSFEKPTVSKFATLTVVNDNSRIVFNSEYNLDKRSDVDLNYSYLEMNIGNSRQLTASFPMESNTQVYWSSRDSGIADVSTNGLVNANSNGHTAIKITSANNSDLFVYTYLEIE